MSCNQNTTLFQGLSNLFCSKDLLPLSSMTLEQQINAITRSVIIIFVIIMLFDVKCAIVFFVVSVIFIILLYYLQRSAMTTKQEQFVENIPDPEDNSRNPKYQVPPKPKVKYCYDYENQPKKPMFCDDNVEQQFNKMSINQRLAGKANPKTMIPPVVITPSHDENWRASNFSIQNNNNNNEQVQDWFQSGYVSMNDIYSPDSETKESYNNQQNRHRKNQNMSFHQRNLNVQTIQPGVYYEPEEIEPVSYNIGITEARRQKIPYKKSDNGDVYYNEYNNNARFNPPFEKRTVGPEDIYDPRFTGYGTSYRSYYDEFVGQPRFYYDDVDAMRMPNYVVRSKVDHLGFSDQYGPMDDNYGVNNDEMREMVNQSFLDNSLSFRNDLQQRLMRKRNAEMAYLRQFPKRTSGQRMLGGMGFRG